MIVFNSIILFTEKMFQEIFIYSKKCLNPTEIQTIEGCEDNFFIFLTLKNSVCKHIRQNKVKRN